MSSYIMICTAKFADRLLACSFSLTLALLMWSGTSMGQWTPTIGTSVVPIACLGAKDSILFAGYAGAYRSTDGGLVWEQINSGLALEGIGVPTVSAFIAKGDNLFAGTSSGVFLSTNAGVTWSLSSTGIDSDLVTRHVNAFIVQDERIIAGTQNAIFASTDNGARWSRSDSGIGTKRAVTCFVQIDSIILAGTWLGGIYSSRDHGHSWSHLGGTSNWEVRSLVRSDSSIFAGTWLGGVLASRDKGLTWTRGDTGLTDTVNHYFLSVNGLATSGKSLFAGTELYGMYISSDNSQHWKSINDGLSGFGSEDINCILVKSPYVFIGTGHGLWRQPLSSLVTSLHTPPTNGPRPFELCQNFPNPFNPETTIGFWLAKRTLVTLTIYNVLGQKIAEFDRGNLTAGYHELRFDGSALATGVYLYQIRTEFFTETKRLLLMR